MIDIEDLSQCDCCKEVYPTYLVKPLKVAEHPEYNVCALCAWEMMRRYYGLRKENPSYPTEEIKAAIAECNDYRNRNGRAKHITI